MYMYIFNVLTHYVSEPHLITIVAAHDNTSEPDNLPLAPWY